MRPALAIALAVLAAPAAARALAVPPLTAHVNDRAGLLEPEARDELERKLAAYERGTGNQFVLLVIPSLEGEPLEDYSIQVAEQWGVGQKGKDNGLLMLVSAGDRKIRIDVGYGLEGNITDALSSRIIRNVLAPAFKRSDFAGGFDQAFDLLMQAAGGQSVDVPNEVRAPPGGSIIGWLVIVFIILMVMRGRGGGLGWFLLGNMLGGGRGWSSRGGGWGGGRGGGGGGGFGGGGGHFGGGGASGGW